MSVRNEIFHRTKMSQKTLVGISFPRISWGDSRVEGANECQDGVLEEGTEAEVEDVTQDF